MTPELEPAPGHPDIAVLSHASVPGLAMPDRWVVEGLQIPSQPAARRSVSIPAQRGAASRPATDRLRRGIQGNIAGLEVPSDACGCAVGRSDVARAKQSSRRGQVVASARPHDHCCGRPWSRRDTWGCASHPGSCRASFSRQQAAERGVFRGAWQCRKAAHALHRPAASHCGSRQGRQRLCQLRQELHQR